MRRKQLDKTSSILENRPGKGALTGRQEEVLDFIKSFLNDNGYPPTVRDIAGQLRIISLNAVRRHLQALEKKGCIQVEAGKSRGIRLSENQARQTRGEIPILGRIAAGPMSEAIEDVEGHLSLDSNLWGETENLFMLRIKGNSMNPRFEEGDLVVVKRQNYAEPGSIVVALSEGDATVKQLLSKRGKYILHPFNQAYSDIPITESVQITGKVVGLLRRI